MSYKELRDKYVALRNEFVRTPSESTRFTELLKEMHRIKLKISELDKSISAR